MPSRRVTVSTLLTRAFSLHAQKHWNEAREVYRQILRSDPANAVALNGLGVITAERRDESAALRLFRRALAHKPQYFEAQVNLARLLHRFNKLQDALEAVDRAIALNPRQSVAHKLLHDIYASAKRPELALMAIERARDLAPDDLSNLQGLISAKRSCCNWSGFDEDDQRIRDAAAAGGRIHPFALLATRADLMEQKVCAMHWARRLEVPLQQQLPPQASPRKGRIRLGYLSGDFHDHATSYLTAELFERHDRSRFEIYAYSYGGSSAGPMQRRIRSAFEAFRDLEAFSSLAAARVIHADQIDILIDLKGYTDRARPEILAHRPAPIQVNYLGFPGTMGASFVDYLIADAVTAPPGTEAFCTERLVRLPDCFQPNDSRRETAGPAPSRASLGLPAEGFVFCAFNAAYKLTPDMFDIWMRMLQAAPGSVLWLLSQNAVQEQNLRREAMARGVASERLVFAPKAPHAEHQARLAAADLFLDTLPVGAFTTASDALWAGLPVLTCYGETPAGRGAASLLRASGLAELVTDSLADYEREGVGLTQQPQRLGRLRDTLAANRATAPLFDIPRFVRNLEAAYQAMMPGAGPPP